MSAFTGLEPNLAPFPKGEGDEPEQQARKIRAGFVKDMLTAAPTKSEKRPKTPEDAYEDNTAFSEAANAWLSVGGIPLMRHTLWFAGLLSIVLFLLPLLLFKIYSVIIQRREMPS